MTMALWLLIYNCHKTSSTGALITEDAKFKIFAEEKECVEEGEKLKWNDWTNSTHSLPKMRHPFCHIICVKTEAKVLR